MLKLYADANVGDGVHIASVLALDPPAHTYEGLRHYAQAMKRAKSEAMRVMEEKRRRKQAMGGHRSGANG